MATDLHPLTVLADPTRRHLFDRLRRRPHSVGELVAHLKVTQPAISQHLKVLKRARLVRARAVGQKRIYGLDPKGIAVLRKYVDDMWTDALSAYAESFEDEP